MGAPYNSLAVANNFIDLAINLGDKSVTPMKLQKLVYFAHGWHLALSEQQVPLLSESVQAWKFGPVIRSIYHEFKDCGNEPIEKMAEVFSCDMDSRFNSMVPKIEPESESFALIKKIWEVYGKYTGVQLSNATHLPGTPWYITWEVNGGKNEHGAIIPNNLIADFFKKQIAKKTGA